MTMRRNLALGLLAGALAAGGLMAARELAEARQNGVVVQRFLLGYFDREGRFVPTAGRGATNVDRNAMVMFVFSGPVDAGPNTRATLPLTLAEQAELAAAQARDPDFDPEEAGYEPGVIPRRKSTDRAAYYVATGSISRRSIVIAEPTPGGETPAPGQFFKLLRPRSAAKVLPDKILFNPRYAQSTYNRPGEIDYNPEALPPNTLFNVELDGGAKPNDPFNVVRNLDGLALAVPFNTTFTTTSRYVQDFTRPEIKSTTPTDGTVNVKSDADIEVTFSEPMDVTSFVPPRFQGDTQWTSIARYTQNPINGLYAGRNLLVVVRVKPQTAGNVIQLRPLQGFGKGPFEVEVIVRQGVTDLSGNSIIRQIQFTFRTENNPNADQSGFVDEPFSNTTKRDPSFGPADLTGDNVLADWNSAALPGLLATQVREVSFDVPVQLNNPNSVNAWANFPITFQILHMRTDMGTRARLVSGFAWFLGNQYGYTYPSTQVMMGHATDTIAGNGFPGGAAPPGPSPGYYLDTPVVVYPSAPYTSPTPTGNVVRGPTFAKSFPYDGQHSVILDISHGGGTSATQERWAIDSNYALNTFTYRSTFNATWNWYFHTRYYYLTPGAEARSLFYDLTRSDARLLPAQIVPTSQPPGTSVAFEWQGAKGDAANPSVIDMSTLTPWLADIRQLANYRYIRFHVTLTNNISTRQAPAVDILTIPYVYR